ncbi:hypothetical protein Trydic_g1930 [Trypoxylus dichotomus]
MQGIESNEVLNFPTRSEALLGPEHMVGISHKTTKLRIACWAEETWGDSINLSHAKAFISPSRDRAKTFIAFDNNSVRVLVVILANPA